MHLSPAHWGPVPDPDVDVDVDVDDSTPTSTPTLSQVTELATAETMTSQDSGPFLVRREHAHPRQEEDLIEPKAGARAAIPNNTMPTEMETTDDLWRDSETELSPQQYFDAKEELPESDTLLDAKPSGNISINAFKAIIEIGDSDDEVVSMGESEDEESPSESEILKELKMKAGSVRKKAYQKWVSVKCLGI